MGRVLLVNDSKFESLVMRDTLASLGYNVKITDEYAAMDQVRTFKPDFVVANLIMKEIHGDQLIAMIKLINPEIKCLLSSNNPIRLKEFRFRKIDGVFQTPIERAQLEKVLKSVGERPDSEAGHETVGTVGEEVPEIVKGTAERTKTGMESGQVQEKPRFCPYCGRSFGANLQEAIVFCPFCGHKL